MTIRKVVTVISNILGRMAIFWVLLFPVVTQADISLSFGLGKSALSSNSFERVVTLGYHVNLSDSFYSKPMVGGWVGGPGESSWFIGAPFGIQVYTPSGMVAFAGVGPAWISQPDCELAGHWQIVSEFGLGLSNKKVDLTAIFMHLSHGGWPYPNQGRDELMAGLRFIYEHHL